MNCLMIGCGNMGSSLLRRWVDAKNIDFTVVDPTSTFSDPSVRMLKDQDALGKAKFDLIVIAIKPQLIDTLLPAYLDHLGEDGTLLSMAAGYSAKRLGALSGDCPVIRIMPNMPASLGQGTSGLFATDSVSDPTLQTVMSMMSLTGDVIQVGSEDELDRVTAVAGSGPGYVFEIARAYADAATGLGFEPDVARRLALSTLAGAVAMALETGDDLSDLRNSVTSKAGTTEAGLNALNGDGKIDERFKETVRAAYDRAVELR